MTDIYHFWGGDIFASPTGDLQTADDSDSTTQQILRALMTNPALSDAVGNAIASADYSDHPQWGAGLPRKIGSNLNVSNVIATIRNIMFSFPGVARTPQPVIQVTPFNTGASIEIQYVNSITGEPDTLSFDINQ